MTFFESLFLIFGVNAILLFIAFFLGKSLLANLLEKDLENLRGNIAAQNEERAIILGRLHEKRADAISLIHDSLLTYTSRCRDYLHKVEGMDEEGQLGLLSELQTATQEFRTTFQSGRLYLSKALCGRIEKVFNQTQSPILKFIFVHSAYTHTDRVSQQQFEGEWKATFEEFADELPPLVEELENEFRSLLGVEK